MSKFINDLKKTCDAAPPSIGFLPRQPSAVLGRMQILALVAPENLDRVAGFIKEADAVLLPVAGENPSKKRLSGFANAAGVTPWGGWLKGKSAGVPDLVKAGCDFVVFSGSADLAIAAGDKPGKILEVEPSLADTLLRAANNLPVDAVFINDESAKEGPLTWQHLMLFQRCAGLLTKPLLAAVPAVVGPDELKLLWEAGVDCAVVDTEDLDPETFKALRKTFDDVKFPPRGRRREKMDAVLPRLGGKPTPVAPEEEEEEE